MKQKVEILLEENVLHYAKRRAADEDCPLCDLIHDALEKYLAAGPHCRDAEVVVSANEFEKRSRSRGSLLEFFRNSPLAGVNLDRARSPDTGRCIDL